MLAVHSSISQSRKKYEVKLKGFSKVDHPLAANCFRQKVLRLYNVQVTNEFIMKTDFITVAKKIDKLRGNYTEANLQERLISLANKAADCVAKSHF